jgi:predicted house-cleaning noncanonical NTP pyrophosphatase (MazG superfamily)
MDNNMNAILEGEVYMSTYNKLVRNKIPGIITKEGRIPNTRILSKTEYHTALMTKLVEEVWEFTQNEDLLEIADILEVIETLARERGVSWEELQEIQACKKEQRGGFDEKIFLMSIDEKESAS